MNMHEFAGFGPNRVNFIFGYIGDGGKTIERLKECLNGRKIDLLFLDHDKEFYLNDLQVLMDNGLAQKGTRVIADNCRIPGAPKFTRYMDEAEKRKEWAVVRHTSKLEYQNLIDDVVYDCTLLK